MVTVIRVQGNVTAFIADEILIIRRQQVNTAAPKSPQAGMGVHVENLPFPPILNQFISKGVDGAPAIADIEPAPPYEILQSSRGVALKVLLCQFV